ncbi:hypothetical protein NPA07_04850 [Mycoplasmopsis caviae]|uniref:Uncharacterized protein n=1 Tax=Mycoplasmopsis caviae TaxID=55603 RepID=A0A3P8K9K4_9BACT|nr:hypothetical protein [Mycoplasmopsis caviae]UUD35104.1 hypothetical protein NPA07_04850 [Mycoplasmopsis caviae]VDR42079.1 Uncharacterised protein [Mycoplasmopsis caviae]
MKKNKFLLRSSFVLSSALPLVVMSQNTTKPKTISPQFTTFKNKAEEAVKKAFADGIEASIKSLKDILKNADEQKNKDYKKWEETNYHLKQLIVWLEKNKSQIIAKPEDYGFNVIFPKVISNLKKYKIGKVELNNTEYKGIKLGEDSKTDYTDATKPYGGVVTKEKDKKTGKEVEEDNFMSNIEFENLIDGFKKELIKEFSKIVFDQKDIPELGKDIISKWEKVTINGKESQVLNFEFIKKDKKGNPYSSYDAYIKDVITPRYLAFDLEQNQKSTEDSEQQNSNSSPAPTPPPIVPGEKPKNQFNTTDIESIPSLPVYINFAYADKNFNELKRVFDGSDEDGKKRLFFFDNPINTRYVYKVESLSQKNGKYYANISLTDSVQTSKKRRYESELNISTNNPFRKAWLNAFEQQIISLKSKYVSLYKALDLDEKIDYRQIGNDTLSDALFHTVDASLKLYLDDSFKTEQTKMSQHYAQYIDTINLGNNTKILSKNNYEFLNYAISSLRQSKINLNPLWLHIPKAFESIVNTYEKLLEINEKFIKKNFEKVDKLAKVKDVDTLFNYLRKDVQALKSSVSINSFSNITWFDKYVEKVADIKKLLNILRIISTNATITKPDDIKKFNAEIQKMDQVLAQRGALQQDIKKIVGSISTAIGLLILLTLIITLIVKRKSIKETKTLIYYIIPIVFASLILLTGVSLLALGLKGI